MMRFFNLIGCDDSMIGTYTKLVDDRNDSAHPNGNSFLPQTAAINIQIRTILRSWKKSRATPNP